MTSVSKVCTFTLLVGATATAVEALPVVQFDFQSVPETTHIPQAAMVRIIGVDDRVHFNSATSGFDFRIQRSSTHESLVGLYGRIVEPDSGFAVGRITGVFAPVTGVGRLEISDGVEVLVADLQLMRMLRSGGSTAPVIFNPDGRSNVHTVVYNGTNPGLQELRMTLDNILQIRAPVSHSLAALLGPEADTSVPFSGSFLASGIIPEPKSLALVGFAVPLLFRRKSGAPSA